MTNDEQDDKMRDLSQSVNLACTKFLQSRGLRTGSWGEARDAACERLKAKDAERAAKEGKR